jgi:predicted DNA-binding transcriptional regulator YafY
MPDNEKFTSFTRCLDVIRSMAGDRAQTVEEIAKTLGTSTRNVYYLLKAMKDYGFSIRRYHGLYTLEARSPFFLDIAQAVNFTQEQATYLFGLLCSVKENSPTVDALKRKLHYYYHVNDPVTTRFSRKDYRNLSLLQRAVKHQRIVILHDYASSNSQTMSDRVVEPYNFLGDDSDVYAYEIKSHKNKTFKISRIGSVEVLPDNWFNTDQHRKVFTDLFMFSSDSPCHVRLRFDLVAYNLMQEEYPASYNLITPDGDKHWIFEADLANYIGIGRFILGLYDHIEVIDDDGLRQYLRGKIEEMGALLEVRKGEGFRSPEVRSPEVQSLQ